MDEELTQRIRAAMPFADLLGLEMVSADSTEVIGRADWTPDRCTVGGVLHGGYLMGLADSIGATLTSLLLPTDASGTTTVESKTNLFRAVRDGVIHVTSRPVHAGRTTIVVQTDITDESNRLISRTIQTQLVLH